MTLHPEHVHPTPGMWDALVELVQAVRIPERFRPRKPRPVRRQPTRTLERLDGDRAQPLRALLDPALTAAARRSRAYSRPRPAVAASNPWLSSEPSVFDLLGDLAERPEHLLEVDVDDAKWSIDGAEAAREDDRR